jgi:hypothetical protein
MLDCNCKDVQMFVGSILHTMKCWNVFLFGRFPIYFCVSRCLHHSSTFIFIQFNLCSWHGKCPGLKMELHADRCSLPISQLPSLRTYFEQSSQLAHLSNESRFENLHYNIALSTKKQDSSVCIVMVRKT